ncbi:MAG: hypothetical protein EOP04_17000 [Proteobacteria bacterium]|nr:MAG: hypothetical protein EOP04_17000 [Pseudomonadota bacterium]
MKIIGNFLFLTVSAAILQSGAAFAAEISDAGVVLSPGDQTIIRGIPTSCGAPLITEGRYETRCTATKPINGKRVLKIEFIERTSASPKELSKSFDQKIIEMGIDPNDLYCDGKIFGPYSR